MSDIDAAEIQLIRMLRVLREDYERASAPIIKRLVEIQELRPKIWIVNGNEIVPLEPEAKFP